MLQNTSQRLSLHETARTALSAYRRAPTHAVLLSGKIGTGLGTIAQTYAQDIGNLTEVVAPVAKTKSALPRISVETIRGLYERTRGRTDGAKRLLVIDDADQMTLTAQNALLKLLEEPANDVHFILTSHNPSQLLPTVRSRLQFIHIPPIDSFASNRFLTSLGVSDTDTRAKLLYVANGLPAEMTRLTRAKPALIETAQRFKDARAFLTAPTYRRLVLIAKLKPDRQAALTFIDDVLWVLERGHIQKPQLQILQQIDRLLAAREAISQNGNIRIHLYNAVV